MLANSTSGESWKIALVPLPWCTSQSTTSTRSAPSESRACRAAIATLANRQKPIARARSAWWPGGRSAREAGALAAREERLHQRARPARGVERRLVAARAGRRVHVERLAASSHARAPRSTYSRGWIRSSCSSVAAGASTGSQPSQSRLSSSASIARIRSARSGWPRPVSCSSDAGWRKNGGIRAGTVPARPWTIPPAPTSRSSAPAPPASTPRSWRPREGARVALVSRSPLAQTASYWAQGGIAAALGGRRLAGAARRRTRSPPARDAARDSAVRVLCEESPARVRDLQELGVQFDADRSGNLALGLEGGHSRRRVVHAGGSGNGAPHHPDAVRRSWRRTSASRCSSRSRRARWPRRTTAAAPASPLRRREGGPFALSARAVILATGGMAALWERTTNPRGAIGAGLSLASAAGALLADLEFMQFHPTALRLEGPRDGFLMTEAVRGEGALLLRLAGRALRGRAGAARRGGARDPHRARAHAASRPSGSTCGRSTSSASPTSRPRSPTSGLNPARDLLPVAPAAHYTMGGIATDLDGRSTPPGAVRGGRVRRARGSTARTGSPRTRSPSASSSGAARRSPRLRGAGRAEPRRSARTRAPPSRRARRRAQRSGATPACAATPPA